MTVSQRRFQAEQENSFSRIALSSFGIIPPGCHSVQFQRCRSTLSLFAGQLAHVDLHGKFGNSNNLWA